MAIPLKQGQSLSCLKKNSEGILTWKAYYSDQLWFESSIQLSDFSILQSTSKERANKLIAILKTCNSLNPNFIDELKMWDIRTDLDFNPSFGFGSSSTLLSLLSQWAKIDPFQLHFKVSNGSGYDIACASAESPIIYQLINGKPYIKPAHFNPPFSDKLWLVYHGHKQKSEESVSAFLESTFPDDSKISLFSTLTDKICNAQSLEEFGSLLTSHEKELSKILSMPYLGQTFNDFDGYVKSLGAWGGDFMLLASNRDPAYISHYLQQNQFAVYFPYKQLVKP